MIFRPLLMTVTLIYAIAFLDVATAMAQAITEMTNSIGIRLVLIPKGTFQMGSPTGERGADYDESQHEVTISKDYYLGVTEVTQGQYEKVMGTNPSYFQKDVIGNTDSSKYPVDRVSWEEAVKFCRHLSEMAEEKEAGRVYRLPTEAEWEYACRAGSKSAFGHGDDRRSLDDYAWHSSNSGGRTHAVGGKKPNALGLFDMHGNLWEWCSDWYADYPKGSVIDPIGSSEGSKRVYRGGSWNSEDTICRSANRRSYPPSSRFIYNGFRLALSSPVAPQ